MLKTQEQLLVAGRRGAKKWSSLNPDCSRLPAKEAGSSQRHKGRQKRSISEDAESSSKSCRTLGKRLQSNKGTKKGSVLASLEAC